MKKVFIGLVLCIPFFAFMYFTNNIHLLLKTKVLIIFGIGMVASYYQAEYHPFKVDNNDVDRGTVLHIIWSVYLSQTLALLEAFFVTGEKAFEYNFFAIVCLIVALFGLFFRSWAFITLGRFFTMNLQTTNDQELVQSGPYRYLRHPSYTGAFLTYTFIPLFLFSYWSALISFILLAIAFYRRIIHEEKMLEGHMGQKYKDFCATRSRLLPMIW